MQKLARIQFEKYRAKLGHTRTISWKKDLTNIKNIIKKKPYGRPMDEFHFYFYIVCFQNMKEFVSYAVGNRLFLEYSPH